MLEFISKVFKSENKAETSRPMGQSCAMPLGAVYSGEKDVYTMGPAKNYNVDYYTMASRGMDLYITNGFTRACILRFAQFAVGLGLELHAEPVKDFLLKKFNVNLSEDFVKDVETLWDLWSTDTRVSSNKLSNLDSLASQTFINCIICGDVLIIKRVIKGNLEYQIVDGRNVFCNFNVNPDNKNRVINGVEIDKNGAHVAYHIRTDTLKPERVEAKDKNGRLVAWLSYADKNRVGTTRGLSPLGAIMQKLDQLDQYSENEVVASNINSKFCATIEHDSNSSGLNPIKNGLPIRSVTQSVNQASSDESETLGEKVANSIIRATNGLIVNMGIGQKLVTHDSKRPNVNYENFLDANAKYMFASMGLPFEVVLMVFQNNFSASRASLKMFEVILKVLRKHIIVDGFYSIVYKQWFEVEVLKNNIDAPKYLELRNNSEYYDNAYTKARFVGSAIPHIDPLKEVNAVKTKLETGLSTYEMALEELGNNMDFDSMVEKLKKEKDKFKENGFEFIVGKNFSGYEEEDDTDIDNSDENLDKKKNGDKKND